jgi:3-methyladenine DNA glycosylase AlkD
MIGVVADLPSATTARAGELATERRAAARALGRSAGDLALQPREVAARLRDGLRELSDHRYRDGQRRVAPGIGPILGVRSPLLAAVAAGFRSVTRRDSPSTLLAVADRLLDEPLLELHWLAFDLLDRTLEREPERTWQLIRAEARRAGDWITVDGLARVLARGILAQPYRWAELEQLVFSPSPWERRLVGSTIATMPFVDRGLGRSSETVRRALAILSDLIGDAGPHVQRAISWALRSLTQVDAGATEAFLREQADLAAATDDGHRAWVVRDALAKLPRPVAASLRERVGGIRRRPGAASTSRAAAAAASFTALGLNIAPADRPVVPRP